MANNRPIIRPNMGPGVSPGSSGWIGPMGMSAMGFGVVPQQPGGGMMAAQPQAATTGMMPQPGIPQGTTLNTWQQQQFMAAQPQQQQQQWMAANQKAAEEQRKQHEQYLKQRQFNEQKNRLMSISGGKTKSGVSADSMINNILGGNGAPKTRIPYSQKQAPVDAGNNKPLAGSKAADWSSMPQLDDIFQKRGNSQLENSQVVSDIHPAPSMSSDSTFVSSHGQHMGASLGYDANNTAVRSVSEASPAGAAPASSNASNGDSSGLALPVWLTGSNLPPVYTTTLALVEGTEPGWVDTGRAYMLLMKTGLPPPFLAVLWEMANRTKPGQLKNEEFTVLLALVAIVQGGQAVNSVEVLKTCSEPVLPIIDHPALLPLVQEYIQKRQQQQQQQLHQQALEQDLVQEAAAAVQPAINMQSPAPVQPISAAAMQCPAAAVQPSSSTAMQSTPIIQSSILPVSAATGMMPVPVSQASVIPTLQQHTMPIVQTPTPAVLQPSAVGFGSKGENDDDEFTDFMSPSGNNQNIAAASDAAVAAVAADDDDDFADFQSAVPACQSPQQPSSLPTMGLTMPLPNLSSSNLSSIIPPPSSMSNLDPPFTSLPSTTTTEVSSLTHSITSVTPNTSISSSSLVQTDSIIGNEDKYAVFRDLEEVKPPSPPPVDAAATTSGLPSMPGSSVDDNPNESFGDFCSSEPTNTLPTDEFSSMAFTNSQNVSTNMPIGKALNQNLNNSNPISFIPNSVPAASFEATFEADFGVFSSSSQVPVVPSDNYADIHEAMKKTEAEQKQCLQTTWNDPFGEFEEAGSSLAVPQIISNIQDDGDDDFGDFVGPGTSDTPPDAASLTAFPRLPEGLAETQSVASLELPGLEMTVGLQQSEGRGSGAGQSPDFFMQPR
ncbi:unnamed protein product [Meganyctiphanes norvegica]|uniref:EH domain-containing protein n=1 Tax=Meganyctiphanes norvegica TaxID=48144 RepID=A0AAV2R1H7_MEGNR